MHRWAAQCWPSGPASLPGPGHSLLSARSTPVPPSLHLYSIPPLPDLNASSIPPVSFLGPSCTYSQPLWHNAHPPLPVLHPSSTPPPPLLHPYSCLSLPLLLYSLAVLMHCYSIPAVPLHHLICPFYPPPAVPLHHLICPPYPPLRVLCKLLSHVAYHCLQLFASHLISTSCS